MNSNKRGFTLIELLVVMGMIAVILGALTSSITASRRRAKIQKATSDVKVITQAILAYENYARSEGDYKLEPMAETDADASSLGFLIGRGQNDATGQKIPAMLMAQLQRGGKMLDPWNKPYRVSIKVGDAPVKIKSASGSMNTGYFLPNFYRLSEEERK